MPTREERRAGADVPISAQRSRAYLYPGQVTRYADGEGPVTIPDHPALAHG